MRQGRREFLALMAAATAVVAIAIDAMLPAFADVRAHFGLDASSADTALIITVFFAGLGIGQLVYGPLADRFGRKPVFMAGLGLYVGAGLVTTVAPSLGLVLIGRFLWGLGAAGPRIVSQAILRDRFSGDTLSRAMAIIMAIFLIVPTLAPALGQLVLSLGSWRYTFLIGPVFGTIVAVWSTRLDETLDPALRRAITPRVVLSGAGEVVRTRTAIGNTLSLMLLAAAFLPYLASSERIYEQIYDRGSHFFLWFAATSIVMAGFTLVSGWVVERIGTDRTTALAFILMIGFSAAFVVVTVSSGGVPGFAAFFVLTTVIVSLSTALTPLLTSRAMQDVGHIAGTAASVIGAVTLVGGSFLSQFVDRAISTTVTPFAVALAVFSIGGAIAAWWATQRTRSGVQLTARSD